MTHRKSPSPKPCPAISALLAVTALSAMLSLTSASAQDAGTGREPAGPPSLTDKVRLPADIAAAKRLRNFLLADRYRPGFHFVQPEGFGRPFDPNGAIYHNGRYHLFYLCQEPRPGMGDVHLYGHISSIDLVHWRHHPPALYPTTDSADRNMLSGNCFLDANGVPTMFFGGVPAVIGAAQSRDPLLETWERIPESPILTSGDRPQGKPFAGQQPYDVWDPHGWIEDGVYKMITGGHPDKTPAPPALWEAPALGGPWKYVGPFMSREMPEVTPEEDLSCPDFFKLGDKWILLGISHKRGARYYTGRYEGGQFTPDYHHYLSRADGLLFAPESVLTPDGRRVFWSWVHHGFLDPLENRQRGAGWSGMLSLPIEMLPRDDERVGLQPAREIEALRYNELKLDPVVLKSDQSTELPISGDSLELQLTIDPGSASRVGIDVLRSPDGAEKTTVYYDTGKGELGIDTTASTTGPLAIRPESTPFQLQPGENLELRIFVDRSIVEVFANQREYAIRLAFPQGERSKSVALTAEGGEAKLLDGRAWNIMPSNPF